MLLLLLLLLHACCCWLATLALASILLHHQLPIIRFRLHSVTHAVPSQQRGNHVVVLLQLLLQVFNWTVRRGHQYGSVAEHATQHLAQQDRVGHVQDLELVQTQQTAFLRECQRGPLHGVVAVVVVAALSDGLYFGAGSQQELPLRRRLYVRFSLWLILAAAASAQPWQHAPRAGAGAAPLGTRESGTAACDRSGPVQKSGP